MRSRGTALGLGVCVLVASCSGGTDPAPSTQTLTERVLSTVTAEPTTATVTSTVTETVTETVTAEAAETSALPDELVRLAMQNAWDNYTEADQSALCAIWESSPRVVLAMYRDAEGDFPDHIVTAFFDDECG